MEKTQKMLRIEPIFAFEDNYIWAIDNGREALVVDPGDATAVLHYLVDKQLQLTTILITHHHQDHTGGIELLKQWTSAKVYSPATENIQGTTHPVHPGDKITLNEWALNFDVINLAGHTNGHVGYYGSGLLFCGDTLFSGGCGRIFEGTAEDMFKALQNIQALPHTTQIYCAHEYTLSNLKFALTVEPDNIELQKYHQKVMDLRQHNQPSIPTTLALEQSINPFLRTREITLIHHLKEQFPQIKTDPLSVFTLLREWKNVYPRPFTN